MNMKDYIMNRESLKKHCEMMCNKFKQVPTSGTYGEHALVLDLLRQTEWRPCKDELPEEYGEYYVTWVTSAFDHPLVEIWEGEVTSEWDDERNDWKFEWLIDDYTKKNYPDAKVIAWMPLIEAYKENEHARDSN